MPIQQRTLPLPRRLTGQADDAEDDSQDDPHPGNTEDPQTREAGDPVRSPLAD